MSATQHPPVMLVGDLFYHPEQDNWWFAGKAGNCRVADAWGEDRVIISALQRCKWLDCVYLPNDEIRKILVAAKVEIPAHWLPLETMPRNNLIWICEEQGRLWANWGKEAGE